MPVISALLRRPAFGLALLFALLAPPPADAKAFDPTTFTLDNGLQVVVIENHRAPIATHMIWYKVGGSDVPPGKSGLAHFLEHLMFKGTKSRAPREFSNMVAKNGGQENAFTGQDYTGYWQSISANRLGLMMELESDRMANLVLTDEVVDPERQVVVEERFERIEKDPSGLLSEQVRAATWTNHPYRLPIVGYEHEIRSLTTENAIDFYRRWYAPNNAILVVAGDVDPAEVRRMAEETYGKIARRAVPDRVRPAEPKQHAARRVVLRDARVRQPSWTRRYIAPSYASGERQHAYALEVLSELLGSGSTSRLYRALAVEQGIAASAGAWYTPDRLDLATFGVWFSPRPGNAVEDIEAAMEAEIERLLADGVTADEVERAKMRMIDSAIFARDSLQAGARVFGSALSTGRTVEDVEAWPDRIGAVTVEQVNAAARAVFHDNTSTTGVLLPAKDDDKGAG